MYLTPQSSHIFNPIPDDVSPTLSMFWPTFREFPPILSLVWCWPRLQVSALGILFMETETWKVTWECAEVSWVRILSCSRGLFPSYFPHPEVASACWKQQPLMQLLSHVTGWEGEAWRASLTKGWELKISTQEFIKNWSLSSAPFMFIFNKSWNIVPKDCKRPTVYKYLQSIE